MLTAASHLQMLSQRLVRASALRQGLSAAQRLPTVQRRTFLPADFSERKVLDAKYPEGPRMTAAQDPEMVSDAMRAISSFVELREQGRG